MNPAVAELLQEIARAKLRAEERRNLATSQKYGIIRENGKLELRLPPPPAKPTSDDCCHSGCTPCIMDTYQDQLCAYNKKAADFKAQYERALDGQTIEPHYLAERLLCGILDPLQFTPIRIMHVDYICDYSRLFVLEATARNFILALGEHIHIRADFDTKERITRPFTPVMVEAADGVVRPHLFVRLYDNRMSEYFKKLCAGDAISVRGPVITQENLTRAFSGQMCVLVGGGSGIAPIFQALQFAHINSTYRAKHIVVVHCARDTRGLWLAHHIQALKSKMPRLSYHTFLSRETHRLSADLL
ncbi:NADH-cytochrome b5 reductase-like, partial [Coemansia sp. RSA 1878]